MGLLDSTTARRLPWLVLGALAAAFAFALMARAGAVVAGAIAAGVLMLHPSWAGTADTAVVSGAAALGACWVHGQGARSTGWGRACWTALGGCWIGLCVAMSRQALVALPLLVLYPALLQPTRFREEMVRGRALASSLLIAAAVVGVPVMLALSPSTWRGGALAVWRLAVAELGRSSVDPAAGWGIWLLSGLALGGAIAVLVWLAGRRFATGAHRPPAEPSALPTLALVGALYGLIVQGFDGSIFGAFGALLAGAFFLRAVRPRLFRAVKL